MPWYDCFDAFAARELPDMEVLQEEPMSRHTTFRTGGPARRMARPASLGQLTVLLDRSAAESWPLLVAGNGSNLLIADDGLDFLVIQTGLLDALEQTGETTIRAGSGLRLAKLSSFAQKQSLSGLEFAHGIPGSVGGAVYMNAGAYGGETSQAVSSVTAWFPGSGVRRLDAVELEFGYRRSVFSSCPAVILEAEFSLKPGDPAVIKAQMDDFDSRRREKQPLEYPSAGSVFKRPAGYFAGALIDQCGLRGFRIGGAQVSEKHAGFIVNTGGATAGEVRQLIAHVQRKVLEQTGVRLETEIKTLP